ncbi:hypothetical protein C497_07849 [Halalkalicoccus jeotgali B3]|uniref:Uncharacterized protein n=1 Tax=Halalkalicoccus jeotgali (strain DSM 18796 / CECT 7217 / JCM 14584 / KCTC 4019 / B3) TaxID=795797 RepID=D8J6V7_HALJB|nr:hypothetical protein HacjB3_12645 [Halalkalicoccus jeotgali B3]ELY38006.1 hypothetical protein C497_07849 [Halalkalicoccus jeotgali B3]
MALLALALAGLVFATDAVAASNVATGLQGDGRDLQVPTWLYLGTGGAAVGASGLLAMFVTDRRLIDRLHTWRRSTALGEGLAGPFRGLAGTLAVVGLAFVVFVGLTGPTIANANLAVLVVFVGVRAGLVMVAYLLANPWPALNPWRALARLAPTGFVEYPDRWGVWPAVCGLLCILWVEVVVPINTVPGTLALAVLAYSASTLTGAVVFGPDDWFRYGDPLAVLFRYYGAVAPIQRTDEGVELVLPGAKLRESSVVDGASGVAFVLLLVWELTYSAFIVVPAGIASVEFLVSLGVPPSVTYAGLLLAGYGLFLGSYWFATRFGKRLAETYVTTEHLAVCFAPPLLAIAAGYHLAHYFTFLVSLSPSLALVLASPLSPPVPPLTLVLPTWFGLLDIGFVLAGHLLAIWAAHAVSFSVFPSRLQAIRSQYPVVIVMIVYTMISLWLISLPTADPAFVG